MTNYPVIAPNYFYRTGPMSCPYLPGRVERNLFTEIKGPNAQELHDRLAGAGFRRSQGIVYRPACPGCRACVPVRVEVRGYRHSRSSRRVMRANADLLIREGRPNATVEQHALFARYQRHRHSGSEMAAMSMADYRAMVEESTIDTQMVEFRSRQGCLVACCLVDRLADGLSAVYSFYAPDEERRGLGNFVVLWLIERAQREDLSYVYLGYWIAACDKMSYKARFRPLQALGATGWAPLSLPEDVP